MASQHLVDLRHDVLAVDAIDLVRRGAERDVQHRPVLGDVDRLAGEHRRPVLLDLGGLRERDESRIASSSTRFFEKSKSMSPKVSENFLKRSGSSSKRFLSGTAVNHLAVRLERGESLDQRFVHNRFSLNALAGSSR